MSISNETAKADEQETKKKSTVDDDPAARNGQIDRVVVEEEEEEEDDDEIIDNDQLIEYKEMVDDLGIFPDKVKINSLSMVAEDHADSTRNAEALYNIIRESLLSADVHCDRKLPLVYVVDSILKNVKGKFIPIIGRDASSWLPVVNASLPIEKRSKLEKVWILWKNTNVFARDDWESMGKCFSENKRNGSEVKTCSKLEKAGLSLKNGRLTLVPSLRNSMQLILDEMQHEESEMEKVSLERLAAINVDLLIQIKEMAERTMKVSSSGGGDVLSSSLSSTSPTGIIDDDLSFLIETRTRETLERSLNWEKLSIKQNMKDARNVIASLHTLVRESSTVEKPCSQSEATERTGALATASVTASILTTTLQLLRNVSDNKNIKYKSSKRSNDINGPSRSVVPNFSTVDKSLFTNDGIKILNETIIGLLYEVGLPFISSADGRRFATQIELSKHLDALFKKGQLEKSMATTQERGWYVRNSIWNGGEKKPNDRDQSTHRNEDEKDMNMMEDNDDAQPDTITMPADETRDSCVICGINFQMIFDNEDGIYKYKNCREIDVFNSEAAVKELDQMFVHVTCWRNLGSPGSLTADQTLQE